MLGTPTLADPFPFSDIIMTLTDPEYSIEWTVEELATMHSEADCGVIEIEFMLYDDGSTESLNPGLFEVVSDDNS